MKVKNISASYSTEEDRLLLELSGDAQETHRFWLTRRATQVLGQAINALLDLQYSMISSALHMHASASDFAVFGQEAAMARISLVTVARKDSQDLGRPILLHSVGYQALSQDIGFLKLMAKNGSGLGFRVGRDELHGILSLLNSKAVQADWGMALFNETEGLSNLMGSDNQSKLLN